jgi:hypothetical protein
MIHTSFFWNYLKLDIMHKRCVVFNKIEEIIISQKIFIKDLVIFRITK